MLKTDPKLDLTEQMLTQLIFDMKASVTNIPRIESLIFPLLKLGINKIQVLDNSQKAQDDLCQIQKQIIGVIQFVTGQTQLYINSLYDHTIYLGVSFQSLLFQMKERCLKNENTDETFNSQDEENETYERAVQRVEVTAEVYSEFYKKLANSYYQAQSIVLRDVDLGLILIDANKFKDQVISHYQKLITQFNNHLASQFQYRLNLVYQKYKKIQEIVTVVHKEIDDIIKQIDFVKRIQEQNIMSEMIKCVEQLSCEKDFLDLLQIAIIPEDFTIYLSLYNLPLRLNGQIQVKFQQLKGEQVEIETLLNDQSLSAKEKMVTFAERFKIFYDRKLQTKEEIQGLRIAMTANDIDKALKFHVLLEQDIQPLSIQYVWWQNYVYNLQDDFKTVMQELEQCEFDIREIQRRQEGLHIEVTQFPIVQETRSQIKQIASLWKIIDSFSNSNWLWWNSLVSQLNLQKVEEKCNDWTNELMLVQRSQLIQESPGPQSFVNYILISIERIKLFLPVIMAFKTVGLEYRHYKMMSTELNLEIKPPKLMLLWISKHRLFQGESLKTILRVAEIAAKEYQIKLTLEKIDTDLKNQLIVFIPFRNTGSYIITGLDQAFIQTEDIQSKVRNLESNIYARHFLEKIQSLCKLLDRMFEIMQLWKNVQKYWAYLSPIFGQNDVQCSMPKEFDMFLVIDQQYKSIIFKALSDNLNYSDFTGSEDTARLAHSFKEKFELLMKSLQNYLMTKRGFFPRLYFLSNDEIIELVGSMDDTPKIEQTLFKMFDGIEKIEFVKELDNFTVDIPSDMLQEQTANLKRNNVRLQNKSPEQGEHQKVSNIGMRVLGVRNQQNEKCEFETPFVMQSQVERFLLSLENCMKNAIIKDIQKCYHHFQRQEFSTWILNFPTQLLLVCLDISLTRELESFFQIHSHKESHAAEKFVKYLKALKPYETIKNLLQKCQNHIIILSTMISQQLNYNQRTKVNNLVINRVYTRDTLQNFFNSDLGTCNDFLWKIHFKFQLQEVDYMTQKEFDDVHSRRTKNTQVIPKWYEMTPNLATHQELVTSILIAKMPYGNEFLSSTARLIITPLTERCFQSLVLALHYDYCGAPVGPAGTGKTETVKELAKKIGRPCFVFNCSSTLDFEAMSKFFKGVCASGLWACFDEFNRIKIEVLSVVSQLINTIQNAKRERATEIFIDQALLQLQHHSAVFITMNPFTHGRTVLPDNLKSLFRMITMNMPNIGLIAEIVLYSAGFIGAQVLSKKIVRLFELSTDQMSSQTHYDFSLRTIKTILLHACKLKMQALNTKTKEDQEYESAQADIQRHLENLTPINQHLLQLDYNQQNDQSEKSSFRRKSKILEAQEELGSSFQEVKIANLSKTDDSVSQASSDLQNRSLKQIIAELDNAEEQSQVFKFDVQNLNEEFIRSHLGIKKKMKMLKESELEETIIRKAIQDMIGARLLQTDALIFDNICQDIFNSTKSVESNQSEMYQMIEHKLMMANMFQSEEYIQNVLNLYRAFNTRHGVMVIGQPVTGKTTIVKILVEVINEIYEVEYKIHEMNFKLAKAQKLGLEVKKDDDGTVKCCNVEDLNKNLLQLTEQEQIWVSRLCKLQKFSCYVINPKSMPLNDLFGYFNEKTREWTDGALTCIMRKQAVDQSPNRKLINFDGPIEPDWVENLNSVLDDNKVLNLITGETIKLMPQSTVLIETVELRNCSPATISRCSMVYLRDETLPLKSQINTVMKRFPSVIQGQIERMDQLVNVFVNEASEKFLKREKMIYFVGKEWALFTFIKVFEALIHDYKSHRYEKYNINDVQEVKIQLYNESIDPVRQIKLKKEKLQQNKSTGGEPIFKFANDDELFLKSLENKDVWMDSFFFVSLVWAYGSQLRHQYRLEFDEWLKNLIATRDQYIQPKPSQKDISIHRSSTQVSQLYQESQQFYEPTEDFTIGNLALLKGNLSEEFSIFDCFFDIYTNRWYSWNDYYRNTMAVSNILSRVNLENVTNSDFFNIFLPTQDTVKYSFLIDLMMNSQQNFCLIGTYQTGKSRLFEDQMSKLVDHKKIMIELQSFSNFSTSETTKIAIKRNLPRKKNESSCCYEGMKFYLLIEDINQGNSDQYGIQNSVELLREIFNYAGWFDAKSLTFQKILDFSIGATMSVREQAAEMISTRLGWHVAGIGYQVNTDEHFKCIFTQILDNTTMTYWPKFLAKPEIRDKIIQATLEVYKQFNTWIKPSPANYLNATTIKHLFKIIQSITEISPQYFTSQENVAGAWLHEVSRTLVDRFMNKSEQTQIYNYCRLLCADKFQVDQDLFDKKVPQPEFTYLNPDSDCQVEIQDYDDTIRFIQNGLNEYNLINYRQPINLVIFSYFALNIVKISRCIKQGGQNIILVSTEGVGAKQMCALAVYLQSQILQELTNDLNYTLQQWEFELKQILRQCGLLLQQQCLVVQEKEIAFPQILANLDTMYSHGELLSMLTREEYDNLLQEQRFKEKNSCGKTVGKIRDPEDQNTINIFRKNCQKHFRSALLLTPRSEILKSGLRQYSRLVGNSTVIWLCEWDIEGFEYVARGLLDKFIRERETFTIDHKEDVVKVMIKMYSDISQQANQYYEETNHFIYITPKTFENLIVNYQSILCKRGNDLKTSYKTVQEGIDGLELTKEAITKLQARLDVYGPQLVAKQLQLEKATQLMNQDYEDIGKKIQLIMAEEKEKKYIYSQAQEKQQMVDRQMKEVVPILLRAVDGLNKLKQTDIDELKSFPRPPEALKALLEAVCIIMKVKPQIVVDPMTWKESEDYWNKSKGPEVLGNPSIVRILSTIDPKKVDAEVIVKLDQLMESDRWNYDKIERACLASEGLFKYVVAIKNYSVVYKGCEPYRNRIDEANKRVLDLENQIAQVKQEVKNIEISLQIQKKKLISYDGEIRVLQTQVDEIMNTASKAAKMMLALTQEKSRWGACQKLKELQIKNLEGDCLLAAAMVNYLAPFTQLIRDKYFEKWKQICIDTDIYTSKNLEFACYFGVPVQVQEWLENCLQNDNSSIQNAIMINLSKIQTILIDPQQMANRWLKRQLVDKKIIILNQDTSDFITQLKLCLKNGSTIIIENVGDKIRKALLPIFRVNRSPNKSSQSKPVTVANSADNSEEEFPQEKTIRSTYPLVKVDHEETEIHPNFEMYITSVSKCPDFGSELSLLANFINFTVTQEACQSQIIETIIEQLETELYQQQRDYQLAMRTMIKDLLKIEDEMIETLRKGVQDETSIMDEALIESLSSGRILAKKINHQLKEIKHNQKKLVKQTAKYLGIAERATSLYFLLTDLNKLNKLYQFTHTWFFDMFKQVLKGLGKDLERTKQDMLEINDKFTRYYFKMVCQSIFEKDKTVFSFLLAYRLLETEIVFDKKLIAFFIRGPNHTELKRKNLESKNMPIEQFKELEKQENQKLEERAAAVPWISKQTWVALEKLSQIPPFDQCHEANDEPSLIHHVLKNPDQWYVYLYEDPSCQPEGVFKAANVVEFDQKKKGQDFFSINKEEVKKDDEKKGQHFTETRTKLTKIREFQQGMPGNYLKYHSISQRQRALNLEKAQKIEKLKREQLLQRKQMEDEKNKQSNLGLGLAAALKRKIELMAKIQNDYDMDRIFKLDMSDYYNSDSEYEPPKPRGDGLEISDEEFEITHFDVNKPMNEDEEDLLAETITNGIPNYNAYKIKPTDFEVKLNRDKALLVNQDLIRLAVNRVFRPELFLQEIKSFIIKYLDRRYHNPPAFDFMSVLTSLKKFDPCLLMIGQNIDAYQELLQTRRIAYSESKLDIVYQPLGSCSNEEIAKLIIKCAVKGDWLLLENIHLQPEIIPNLEKFLQNIVQTHRSFKKNVNIMIREEIMAKLKAEEDEIERQLRQNNPNYDADKLNIDPFDPNYIAAQERKEQERKIKTERIFATMQSHRVSFSQKAIVARIAQMEKMRAEEIKNCQEPKEPLPEELALKDLHLPPQFQFMVHKDFRFFMSTNPEYLNLPITFARLCTKVSLELPQAIKLNVLKSLNGQKNEAVSTVGPRRKEYQKLYFAITVMHSVINQREKFGNFGWSRPYQFSQSDLSISLSQLKDVCQSDTAMVLDFPIKLVRYLICQLNYGGRVTDYTDFRVLKQVVNTFINEQTYMTTKFEVDNFLTDVASTQKTIGGFKAVSNPNIRQMAYDMTGYYYFKTKQDTEDETPFLSVKEGGKIKHYCMANNHQTLSYLKSHVIDHFPNDDMAEIFGLHHSATVNANKMQANQIIQNIYQNQFIVKLQHEDVYGVSAEVSNEQHVEFQAFYENLKFLLSKIPAVFDLKMVQRRATISFNKPMNTLLNKEVQRYNLLLQKVRESLYSSILTLEGVRKLDKTTEQTLNLLKNQQTPIEWMSNCYPCQNDLASFVENLQQRVNYIQNLLIEAMEDDDEASDFDSQQIQQEKEFTVREFWFPGFFDQKSFLAAICQSVARQQRVSIDLMKVEWSIMRENEPRLNRKQAKNADTYYIYGISIFGAEWNDQEQDLCDISYSQTNKLLYPMPYFKLKVIKTSDKKEKEKRFQCPLYVTTGRNRIPNCPSDERGQWICDVPLPLKEFQPGFWVKRQVCLVCSNQVDI